MEAVLFAHLKQPSFRLSRIQPDESLYGGDAGPHGGGWKGVRGWCKSVQAAGGLEAIGALRPDVHLLIIHVDADIVLDKEHDAAGLCPPPENNILAAEALVMGWLGLVNLPENVLIWVPGMATEAWLLRAIFPDLPESRSCLTNPLPPACVECLKDPAVALEGKQPKFVRRKGKDLRKIATAYRDAHPALAEAWGNLVDSLWSAGRLQQGLSRCIPASI
ncbi:hypothetical protein [Synechococcus sp. BO 8801]|uniref:hypothetical protein n=1 Tax=Synechococcus sp. BO 8801 TaxID=169670 RepID=UPI00117C348F|nr:hypothetical protein [Synechococcus sp. BO 8801]